MSRRTAYSLAEQRQQSAAHKNLMFMEFFEVLDEAVTPFKSGHKMPKANAGDSRISVRTEKGKPKIKFEFLATGDNLVKIVLDARDLCASPEEYIDNMLECLNQGMKQARENSRIIIPVGVSQAHLKAVQ